MIGKSEQGRFSRIQRARRICELCPDRLPCLAWALENNQEYGIWGGMTERERNVLRKRMRELR